MMKRERGRFILKKEDYDWKGLSGMLRILLCPEELNRFILLSQLSVETVLFIPTNSKNLAEVQRLFLGFHIFSVFLSYGSRGLSSPRAKL